MSANMLTHTLENYLEVIFQIIKVNKVARSMEIADRLKVKRSSVTVALRSLAEKGLINYQSRSYVTLTDKGMGMARCVDRRHQVLFTMFTRILNLSNEEADQAACSMEHGMTSEVCRKMSALLSAMSEDSQSVHTVMGKLEALASRIVCHTDCGYLDTTQSITSSPGVLP